MPTIEENRQRWDAYDWTEGGDEWSAVWGSTTQLWWGAVYPRIQHLLPVSVILEIAPGYGRFTQFLKTFCDELLLIDLSERCIEACQERFRADRHVGYYLGDGSSLDPIPDNRVDFVFSFDSLVHCEAEVIEGYLSDLPKKMTARGAGFIHHSNFAALIDPQTGKTDCENEHWRGTSVSADLFAENCRKSGLVCVSQELVNWGATRHLTDSLSIFSMPHSPLAAAPGRRRDNPFFMEEALSLGRIASFAVPDQVDPVEREVGTAPGESQQVARDKSLELLSFASITEYGEWKRRHQNDLSIRRQSELEQTSPGRNFEVEARCIVCNAPRRLKVTWDYAFEQDGILTPNWREQLLCPGCGLNGRMRATIHLLERHLRESLESDCYITEQTSSLYRTLSSRYAGIVGSEYLRDGTAPGEMNRDGYRHEDLTQLSFDDGVFSLVVSLDVLEHVPTYERALCEAHRVLKSGGSFFFSAPFRPDVFENLVRARLRPDGTVEHLLPPEYHYDPLEEDGVLAFYQFGWELLQATKEAGFSAVTALFCHSFEYGYYGPFHAYFKATRT